MKKLLLIIMSLVAVTASAADFTDAQGVNYIISPAGSICYVTASPNATGDITIPTYASNDGHAYRVTSIEEGAFRDNKNITKIVTNNEVKTIGKYTFYNCTNLATAILGEAVDSVSDVAFLNCPKLTSVVMRCNDLVAKARTEDHNFKNIFGEQVENYEIGDKVTDIGRNAFFKCEKLETVYLGKGLKTIGHSAFNDCYHLTKVKLKSTVETGNYCFFYCKQLTDIDITKIRKVGPAAFTNTKLSDIDLSNTEEIGRNAFSYCDNIKSVHISGKITYMDYAPFCNCSNLESITVDSSNPIYDSRDGCNAIIETKTNKLVQGIYNTVIPKTVTSIGEEAFDGCTFTNISIPNSVTAIDNMAFSGCKYLTSIALPVNLKKLDHNLFNSCYALKFVSIPASVTEAMPNAFCDCENLSTVIVNWRTPFESEYLFSDVTNGTLIVPSGTKEAYRNSPTYQYFTTIIEMSAPDTSINEDVNQDGQVNSLDVLKVYKYMQTH